ncbi:MAG: hypothetical protein SFU98_06510 [Leptospiraceae bacterium]|nr:hypothetical protein [Leptospiraceae bacterium]
MKEHNQGGFLTFLIILTLNILFFGYISFVHPGVKDVNKVGASPAAEKK